MSGAPPPKSPPNALPNARPNARPRLMREYDEAVRAAKALRLAGNVTAAQRQLDNVLDTAPAHALALHERARLALARGEADAAARFDAALKQRPGDGDLWLGKAQALDVAGNRAAAITIARQLAGQAPGFIEGLEFLSGLLLAQGHTDYTSPFSDAALARPRDPNIAAAHVDALAGLDHAAKAADIAKEARARFPGEPHFALLEAANASAAGQWDRAEAIFAGLEEHSPSRLLHEARHRIRAADWSRAQALLEEIIANAPWSIAAWALRGIIWRMTGDERAAWLHEQPGLVQMRPLSARAGLIDDAAETLRALHQTSAMPLGQSLRGGTQTRGILFHRHEKVLAELHRAIDATLTEYRRDLPAPDAHHPLLRHHGREWALAGSWSVRLISDSASNPAGDHHTAHIHPAGIISSALYVSVPQAVSDDTKHQGWLELGRPPSDLGCGLAPVTVIRPQKGHLALFPSTLYHGTCPFTSRSPADRMTIAFDVTSPG